MTCHRQIRQKILIPEGQDEYQTYYYFVDFMV